jgi:hypothetical protein
MSGVAKSRCLHVNSALAAGATELLIHKLLFVIRVSMSFESECVINYLPTFIAKYLPQYAAYCDNQTHIIDVIKSPEYIISRAISKTRELRCKLLDFYARSQKIVYLLYIDRPTDIISCADIAAELYHAADLPMELLIQEYPKLASVILVARMREHRQAVYQQYAELVAADITVLSVIPPDNTEIADYFAWAATAAANLN